MTRKYRNYTDQDIIEMSKDVFSLSKLLEKLGLRKAGGNFANMKRNLQRLNVDTSHWTGKAWNKNQQLKDWSEYTKSREIKKHLIKKRGNKCENCLLDLWFNEDIPIELHHIDGDRTNNCVTNFQLLCPNCHALTDNWRGRNIK